MEFGNKSEMLCLTGDCCDCPYFFRFDICSPENSLYHLDIYENMWARQRCEAENRPWGGPPFST
jgi:hypothetical protein